MDLISYKSYVFDYNMSCSGKGTPRFIKTGGI